MTTADASPDYALFPCIFVELGEIILRISFICFR